MFTSQGLTVHQFSHDEYICYSPCFSSIYTKIGTNVLIIYLKHALIKKEGKGKLSKKCGQCGGGI